MSFDKLLEYWKQDKSNAILAAQLLDGFLSAGDFDGGLDFFEQLETEAKQDLILQFKYGLLLMAKGKFQSAEKQLESVYAKKPSQVQIAYNLAYCRIAQGRFDEAMGILTLVAEQWKDCPDLLILLARCVRMNNKPELGIDYVKQYLSVVHNDMTAQSLLSLLYCDSGHYEAALAIAEQLLSKNEGLIEALSAAGTSAIIMKQFEKAKHWLNLAVVKYPEAYGLWREKGTLELATLRIKEAEKSFSKAVDLRDNDLPSIYLLGLSQMVNERYNEAISSFSRVTTVDAEHPDSYAGMALSYLLSGNDKSANVNLDKALELNASSAMCLLAKSIFLLQNEEEDKAEEIMKTLLPVADVKESMPYIQDFYDRMKMSRTKSIH